MNNVIQMSDWIYRWKQIFAADNDHASLQIHYNTSTKGIDIVINVDDGKSVNFSLNGSDAADLLSALVKANNVKIAK